MIRQDNYEELKNSLIASFDKEKSLALLQEATKRNEGGFLKKWKIGRRMIWYPLIDHFFVYGRIGILTAYLLRFLMEPLIIILSLYYWMRPLYRNKDHLAKKVSIVANEVYYWWFYRVGGVMKKCQDGILPLDENLVPRGVLYDGWELAEFSAEEKIQIIKIFADGVKKHLTNIPDGIKIPDILPLITDVTLKQENGCYIIRGSYNYALAKQIEKNAAQFVVSRL